MGAVAVVGTDTNGGVDGVPGNLFVENVQERLGDFDLSDAEKTFYSHSIADGGVLVIVEVDDEDAAMVQELFNGVDAQQMKTVA